MKQQFTIPERMHFIWAGGKRTLPKDSQDVITSWSEGNPKFKVWIWYDSETTPKEILDNAYSELLKNTQIKLKDIKILEDIETEGKGLKIIRNEIEKLRPNYGASSDLLRYLILYWYGGFYADSDVKPGKLTLTDSKLFIEEFFCPKLYVDKNSQNQGMIGNDMFIVTPKHEIMKKIYLASIENYATTIKYLFEQENFNLYSGTLAFRKSWTITCTGPQSVRNIVEPQLNAEKKTKDELKTCVSIPPRIICQTKQNTGYWLTVPPPRLDDDEPSLCGLWEGKTAENKAIDLAIKSMSFNIDYSGFLEFDSYIDDILIAIGCLQSTEVAMKKENNVDSDDDFLEAEIEGENFEENNVNNDDDLSDENIFLVPKDKKEVKNLEENNVDKERILLLPKNKKEVKNLDKTAKIVELLSKQFSSFDKNRIKYVQPISLYKEFNEFCLKNFEKIIFNELHINQAKNFLNDTSIPEDKRLELSQNYTYSAINYFNNKEKNDQIYEYVVFVNNKIIKMNKKNTDKKIMDFLKQNSNTIFEKDGTISINTLTKFKL